MAGIDLLRVSDNPPREIAQRTASELKNRERIQSVVIIVVIIDGELLVLVQDLVEANLELIRAVRGFDHVLSFGVAASRAWHKPHQARGNRIKALGRNNATCKNGVVRLRSARRCGFQAGLRGWGEVSPACRSILKDV